MKNNLTKRIIYVVLANFALAFAIAILKVSNFGTDPFNSMNIGLSSHLPVSYGTMGLLMNLFLFIPVLIYRRSAFGIGAFINMFILAYFAQFHLYWLSLINITAESMKSNMPVRILILVFGVALLCLSVAVYMECDLGQGPYDVLGDIVQEKTNGKIKFKWFRVFTDLLCMSIGFVCGTTIGVGTVFTAFFTGPLVSFCRENFAKKLLGK